MKVPRNIKHVAEVCDLLKVAGKEVNQQNVSNFLMDNPDMYIRGRYGHLKQGDFAKYFREYYQKVDVA